MPMPPLIKTERVEDAEYARLLDVIKQNAFHFEPGEGDNPQDAEPGEGDNPQDADDPKDADDSQGLGKALFEFARAANHSCEPNATYAMAWDAATAALTMSFVALSPIAASGEVLISYVHPSELASLSYAERRRRPAVRKADV